MDDATRHQLDKLRSECGCRAGAVTMLVFLGTYALSATWTTSVTRTTREHAILVACVAVAGALIGKVLGVLWSRYRYWQLLRAQESRTT